MRSVYFTANTFIYFSLSFIRFRNYLIGLFLKYGSANTYWYFKRMWENMYCWLTARSSWNFSSLHLMIKFIYLWSYMYEWIFHYLLYTSMVKIFMPLNREARFGFFNGGKWVPLILINFPVFPLFGHVA